jgi:hypothetical protein
MGGGGMPAGDGGGVSVEVALGRRRMGEGVTGRLTYSMIVHLLGCLFFEHFQLAGRFWGGGAGGCQQGEWSIGCTLLE